MSIRIKGTTYNAEVDSHGNLQATGPLTSNQSGFASLVAENDAGNVTGSRYMKELEVEDDYRLITANEQLIWSDVFAGSALNTAKWTNTNATMTTTIVGGFAQLNAGLNTASGSNAILTSRKFLPIYKQNTTRLEWEAQFSQLPVTNNVCEMGLFTASGTTAPTSGAFFRVTSAGLFYAVVNFSGTEQQSSALNFSTLVNQNTTHSFLIYLNSTSVTFWIDNILVAEIENSAGQGASIDSMSGTVSFRTYNTAATSSAQVLKVGCVSASILGTSINQPFGHIMSGNDQHSSQGQTGGTMGGTAISPNGALTATAVPSGTTVAAGQTGLGGETLITMTMAINTPVIVFSYLNPAGTSALPGKDLYISGVTLQSTTVTAITAVAPILTWSVAYGHTAISLATTESVTTKAPRKILLGCETLLLTAGTNNQRIAEDFVNAPICVHPGEYIQLVLTNRSGTAATAGGLLVSCNITGYFA